MEQQCETIQHLHDLGELGLILYYVGIVLPDIPEEVLALAEAQGFIIICMPKMIIHCAITRLFMRLWKRLLVIKVLMIILSKRH